MISEQEFLRQGCANRFSLSSAPQILRADHASVSPLWRLCRFHLFLLGCDLRFLFCYHLGEVFLAFLSRLCVDVEFLSTAIGESWIEASFPQAVIDLIYAPCAGLAVFGLPRLEIFFHSARFLYSRLYLCFGHRCVCTADFAVNFDRCLGSHGVGHVGIDVEGGLRADVSYHIGQYLYVHSVFERHGGKCVAQVVEADLLTSRPFKEQLESLIECRRVSRLTDIDG